MTRAAADPGRRHLLSQEHAATFMSVDNFPRYFVDFSGFFDECVQRWTAAAADRPPGDAYFDVIRRIRTTEYWLVTSSRLACALAHLDSGGGVSPDQRDQLGLEVEAHLEAFYLSAFQLQEEVEFMARVGVRARAFKADGVTRSRNQLIVHQHNQGNRPQGVVLGCSGNGDAHLRLGWRGSISEPGWQDPGLHKNADELRRAFLDACRSNED